MRRDGGTSRDPAAVLFTEMLLLEMDGCPTFARAYVGREWFVSAALSACSTGAYLYSNLSNPILLLGSLQKGQKTIEALHPVFFGPRTPDFLSRLVALSNFIRLSLMKSRTRGHVWC
jgi:hypothetical protein